MLLLLNPDTVVLDQAIDRLLEFAEAEPRAGIWGGRTLFADGSLNPTSCWGKMTLWSLITMAIGLKVLFPNSEFFNSEGYGRWKRDTIRHVDIVTGCLLLIRRQMWNQLGGFKPEYFMYGEEADLCLRARKLGARPMITPQSTIVHYGSASDTYRPGKVARVLAARITLVRHHWGPIRRRIAEAIFLGSRSFVRQPTPLHRLSSAAPGLPTALSSGARCGNAATSGTRGIAPSEPSR